MIGKLVTAIAGRSLARTLGGASAGPAGLVVGAALPIVLPRIAATLGPAGMVAAAVGTLFFGRYMARRAERRASLPIHAPINPKAVMGADPTRR